MNVMVIILILNGFDGKHQHRLHQQTTLLKKKFSHEKYSALELGCVWRLALPRAQGRQSQQYSLPANETVCGMVKHCK